MEKIEDIVKKINTLDLDFNDTNYHEIEFCTERCMDDKNISGKLSENEKNCYCNY